MAKKLAMVMTVTSRFLTWVSSWPSTPSSSLSFRRRTMPVVTQTTAFLGFRPVAKALGTSVSATAILGLGISACATSRSTIACSLGSSSEVTTFAPMDRSTSLSEKKYCTPSRSAAMTPMKMRSTPRTNMAPMKKRYTSARLNMTKYIRNCRPLSLPIARLRLAIPRSLVVGSASIIVHREWLCRTWPTPSPPWALVSGAPRPSRSVARRSPLPPPVCPGARPRRSAPSPRGSGRGRCEAQRRCGRTSTGCHWREAAPSDA